MEKHAFHVWRYGAPLLVLAAGAAALWPFRHQLTAEAIAAFSPADGSGGVVPGGAVRPQEPLRLLSHVRPSRRRGTAVSLPLALAVNLCGTGVAQTIPFSWGGGSRGTGGPGGADSPGGGRLPGPGGEPVAVRLSAAAGGGIAGDVVSLYLGASGTPYGTYLSAGLLGGLPRIACATVLGGALWQPGSGRFWLSLAAGGALTALSGVIWLLWRRRRRA